MKVLNLSKIVMDNIKFHIDRFENFLNKKNKKMKEIIFESFKINQK